MDSPLFSPLFSLLCFFATINILILLIIKNKHNSFLYSKVNEFEWENRYLLCKGVHDDITGDSDVD